MARRKVTLESCGAQKTGAKRLRGAAVRFFPIVGVGASPGGLEAFTQWLGALPPDTGLAFVLVQHLDPKHESMLTALPIHEARDGMEEVKE